MSKNQNKKRKITRGISEEFAKAFTKTDLYNFYLKNKNELIIGVRNNYLSLYYNCDSIAKIKYTYKSIVCEIPHLTIVQTAFFNAIIQELVYKW